MMKIFPTFAVSTRVPYEPILGTDEGATFLGCLMDLLSTVTFVCHSAKATSADMLLTGSSQYSSDHANDQH